MGMTGEVLYSRKGAQNIQHGEPETDLQLHYLVIPMLFTLKPLRNLSIQAGPEFGYLLNTTVKYLQSTHKADEFKRKLDISVDLGINYTIAKNINVGARYIYGLSSLFKVYNAQDSNGLLTDKKVRNQNRVLQLSIGYTFGKKD